MFGGNPFFISRNPFCFGGNPFVFRGNPFLTDRKPFVFGGNPFFISRKPFVFGGKTLTFGMCNSADDGLKRIDVMKLLTKYQ